VITFSSFVLSLLHLTPHTTKWTSILITSLPVQFVLIYM